MNTQRFSIFRILWVCIGCVVVVGLSRSIYDLWKRRDIVVERKNVLTAVMAENDRLKKEMAQTQTPEFLEKQAREKLNMAKPDDVVVLMSESSRSGDAVRGSGKGKGQEPAWRLWWDLFF